MKAALYTLGCKVNQYESQIMEQRLAAEGFEIVGPAEAADVYIVNSCTVTAESDRKTRQVLRRFKKRNPAAVTVLTGCFPQSAPEKAAALDFADVVTGVRERGEIGRIAAEALRTRRRIVRVSAFDKAERFEPMEASAFDGHTRAFVKIEDGCTRFCSYCIIPYSRGPVRSKPLAELSEELTALARNGYREAVLVGINLSAYGTDLGATLADALEAADRTPNLERVRLGSLEPNLITPAFAARAQKLRLLCPHFHLSLQSGCAATLSRMNRHYTPAEFAEAVRLLREVFPGCAVTTDVIVGFPGETDDEFAESLAFVKKIRFAKTHVFVYSPRPGTRAATLSGTVDPAVKEARSAAMIAASSVDRAAFLAAHRGHTLPVLFESRREGGLLEGFAPDYTPVRAAADDALRGQIRRVHINRSDSEACFGELCPSG